jgi:hypothetical protein
MSTFNGLGTAIYSTKRPPAYASSKRGGPTEYLTGVSFVSVMPADISKEPIKTSDPIQGQANVIWEAYAEKQSHVEDSVTVDQVPDILKGDFVVDESAIEYHVRRVEIWPLTTATKGFLRLILEEPI